MPGTKSRKQLERDAQDESRARLAYIGTLASGLAHEIRTPLSSIVMNAELLAEDARSLPPGEADEVGRRAERIRSEATNLRKTLDEFLQFARPPRLQLVPTRLHAWLDELLEPVELECRGRDIRIVKRYQEELYPVLIDQGQFSQVVLNILTNAVEAIGEHGTITVTTAEDDRWVYLRIADDGGGVSEEAAPRVFEVFFTTKETGSGLGLGIARRIAREHGGDVTLENAPGRGATFAVRLPKGKFLEYRDDEPGSFPGDGGV